MKQIHEHFVHHAKSGGEIKLALSRAVAWSVSETARRAAAGEPVESALSAVGFKRPEVIVGRLASQIECPSIGHHFVALAGGGEKHPLFDKTCSIIVQKHGGVGDVPSVDCIVQHLPTGRKPTPEELKKAWEECLGL